MSKDKRIFTPLHGASVLVGILGYYLPADLMDPGLKRSLTRVAGLAAMIGVFAKASSTQPVESPKGAEAMDASEQKARAKLDNLLKSDSKAKTAAISTAAFGAAGLAIYTFIKFDEGLAKALSKRGVPYPATVGGAINLGLGVATVAMDDEWKFGLPTK